jgi:hypothetical protein
MLLLSVKVLIETAATAGRFNLSQKLRLHNRGRKAIEELTRVDPFGS